MCAIAIALSKALSIASCIFVSYTLRSRLQALAAAWNNDVGYQKALWGRARWVGPVGSGELAAWNLGPGWPGLDSGGLGPVGPGRRLLESWTMLGLD